MDSRRRMGVVGKRISGEEWEQMETEFQEKNEMEMSDEYQGMIKNIFSQYDIRFASPIRRSRKGDPSGSLKALPHWRHAACMEGERRGGKIPRAFWRR